MKGIIIQHPLEIRVAVEGDAFCQGDSLCCALAIKNHSNQPQTIATPRLELVLGNIKKVKQRSTDAFSEPRIAPLSPLTIAPSEMATLSHTFQLEPNCAVSDKSQSLYLVFGEGEGIPAGQLPLTVHPHLHMQKVLELMESAFQFVLRDITYSKGWVVGRFKASSARQFSLVEELALRLQRREDCLALQYEFKVKRFDTELSSVSVKKGKATLDQFWPHAQYLIGGAHVDYEAAEKRIHEALSTVATGI